MRTIILTFTIIVLFLSFSSISSVVVAQGGIPVDLGSQQKYGVDAKNNANTVSSIIGRALDIITIVGSLAVVIYFIWGAAEWILSGGDKEKVANARKRMTHALIGLALLALSYFIIKVVGTVVGLDPLSPKTIPTLGTPATGA